jgi:hypothetical protein
MYVTPHPLVGSSIDKNAFVAARSIWDYQSVFKQQYAGKEGVV